MISVVNAVLGQMTDAGAAFGSMEARIDMQNGFAKTLGGTLTGGVRKLVDADMEQEPTKLAALQTQQCELQCDLAAAPEQVMTRRIQKAAIRCESPGRRPFWLRFHWHVCRHP